MPETLWDREERRRRGVHISERDISGGVADKRRKRRNEVDKIWRRVKGRDMHPQRGHRSGKRMSHTSELKSVMLTLGISQICSHTEGAEMKESWFNKSVNIFKRSLHLYYKKAVSSEIAFSFNHTSLLPPVKYSEDGFNFLCTAISILKHLYSTKITVSSFARSSEAVHRHK